MTDGIFEASIKLPNNPNFWPAFWLYDGVVNNLTNQEIDIYEFYDNNISGTNCDVYHSMKMTLHKGLPVGHCDNHGCKFAVKESQYSDDFFNSPHVYRLEWNKFHIKLLLDGNLVGYHTRFYNKAQLRVAGCKTTYLYPGVFDNYECSDLATLNNNKKIEEDLSFPVPEQTMKLIINQRVNLNYNPSNFSLVDNTISIDYVRIWQPVDCTNDIYLNNQNTVETAYHNAGYITGKKIYVDGPGTNFTAHTPQSYNQYLDIPYTLQATDEIALLQNFSVEEGQYLEASIYNCTGLVSQRLANDSNIVPQFLDQEAASTNNSAIRGAEESLEDFENDYDMDDLIKIYPNPSRGLFHITYDELIKNTASGMKVYNSLGDLVYDGYLSDRIDLSSKASGIYVLNIYLSGGKIASFKLIKQGED